MADTSAIFQQVTETLDEVAQKLKVESVLITRDTPTHFRIEGTAGPKQKIYKVGTEQKKGSAFEDQHELYCEYVVSTGVPFLFVRDSTVDPVWDGNQDQVKFGLINYLGYPIRDAQGNIFGTVCALDTEPHDYSDDDKAALQRLQSEAQKALKLQTSSV